MDSVWMAWVLCLAGYWAFCSGAWVMVTVMAVRLYDGAHYCGMTWVDEPESLILAQSERWRHA